MRHIHPSTTGGAKVTLVDKPATGCRRTRRLQRPATGAGPSPGADQRALKLRGSRLGQALWFSHSFVQRPFAMTTTAAPIAEPAARCEVGLTDGLYLAELRAQMLRFAQLQLNNAHAAEDAVQEALVGALKNAKSFAGRAALKTWVFAILKNKIADVLRSKHRTVDASSLLHSDDEDEDFSELFDRKGFWLEDERPAQWGNPHAALQQVQFWRMFELCLDALPGQQARVFMMKEFIELDSDEICQAVGIQVSNLHVMLHRARLRLRECLENRWFLAGERS